MGLKQEVQEAMQEAFDGDLADAIKPFEYIKTNALVYAAGSAGGEVTPDKAVSIPGRGAFIYTDPTRKDREADLFEPMDFELIILQNEIAVSDFEIDSVIESSDHGTLRIAKYIADPAGASWTLYLKRVGK